MQESKPGVLHQTGTFSAKHFSVSPFDWLGKLLMFCIVVLYLPSALENCGFSLTVLLVLELFCAWFVRTNET